MHSYIAVAALLRSLAWLSFIDVWSAAHHYSQRVAVVARELTTLATSSYRYCYFHGAFEQRLRLLEFVNGVRGCPSRWQTNPAVMENGWHGGCARIWRLHC